MLAKVVGAGRPIQGGWEEAVSAEQREVAKTIRHISGVEVLNWMATWMKWGNSRI